MRPATELVGMELVQLDPTSDPYCTVDLKGVIDRSLQSALGADWRAELLTGVVPSCNGGLVVLVKPNWVLHRNKSGDSLSAITTNGAFLRAVVETAAELHPARIIVGDSPIQEADFDALVPNSFKDELRDAAKGVSLEVVDFRSASYRERRSKGTHYVRPDRINRSVEFDLGSASRLDAITVEATAFRNTMYDPAVVTDNHRPGRHIYCVCKEVLEADIVLNIPKLKTHRKTGISAALKNFVGVNCRKGYLPHHRKGGARTGGDCYPGRSVFKAIAEDLYDRGNRAENTLSARLLLALAYRVNRMSTFVGHPVEIEGGWYGNDTAWRMVLDVASITERGTLRGELRDTPQRKLLTITDGIVSGQGDGPLSNRSYRSGIVTCGLNPTLVDIVNAEVLGVPYKCIPLLREAATDQKQSWIDSDVQWICMNGEALSLPQLRQFALSDVELPTGWGDEIRRSSAVLNHGSR